MLNKDSIVVSGIGMVSSLGHDSAMSCSAYRAGLSRASELDEFMVLNENNNEFNNVIAQQIPVITSGFEEAGLLSRIGIAALQDLFKQNDFQRFNDGKTGFFIALPNPKRFNNNIPNDDSERTIHNEQNTSFSRPNTHDGAFLSQRLLESLVESAECHILNHNIREFYCGHSGVIFAIENAVREISAGKIERCIVGGLDSLLESATLEWLFRNQRLKVDEKASGLQPGEAGGFILIEKYSDIQSTKSCVLAVIDATATAYEPDHLFTGKLSQGGSLSKAIQHVLLKDSSAPSTHHWVISDQNGEYAKANEWSYALTKLMASFSDLSDALIEYPAVSFGDTGAASGALAICLAIRAFVRKYAPSNKAIIISASDKGERAALRLMNHYYN
mgnify:CR=1 FL=1